MSYCITVTLHVTSLGWLRRAYIILEYPISGLRFEPNMKVCMVMSNASEHFHSFSMNCRCKGSFCLAEKFQLGHWVQTWIVCTRNVHLHKSSNHMDYSGYLLSGGTYRETRRWSWRNCILYHECCDCSIQTKQEQTNKLFWASHQSQLFWSYSWKHIPCFLPGERWICRFFMGYVYL